MASAYSSDMATVYHGRAEDVLPTLERGSVDLIVTDPPYGQNWQSGRRTDTFDVISGDDGDYDPVPVIGLALPVLRRRRHLYVFGPADLTSLPVTEPAQLIWDKISNGPGDLSSSWSRSHEPISFATAHYSKAERAKGEGRLAARLRRGSVLRVQRPSAGVAATRHQTEKPVVLMRQLIESSSMFGETVLDPFAGSGATLVAAILSGRRAVGIELNEGHVATIIERVKVAEKLARAMEGV